uniref:Uncharacterized protein n=1 Tax=Opuntia streptacantha TaxID=393608 RepID=A0A7C9ATV8_OPUST
MARECLQCLESSHLLWHQRQFRDVEVFVQHVELINVLLLHLLSCIQQLRFDNFIIIKNLVNDNVVSINLKLGELLHQSLCFIERKELRDANTDKCSQVWVLKLLIYLFYYIFHALKPPKNRIFTKIIFNTKETGHLTQ